MYSSVFNNTDQLLLVFTERGSKDSSQLTPVSSLGSHAKAAWPFRFGIRSLALRAPLYSPSHEALRRFGDRCEGARSLDGALSPH